MLDLTRYYPPECYIGDVYLEYLAEKKKRKRNRPVKGLLESRMNEILPVQGERHFKTGKRLEEAHMSCCTFYVMIYDICIEKLSLSSENWFSG